MVLAEIPPAYNAPTKLLGNEMHLCDGQNWSRLVRMSETGFQYKTDRNCSGSVMNPFSFRKSKV